MTRKQLAAAVDSRNGVIRRRLDIARIRREEIIDAAATVIAEQGIQNLSLSEIESRTGMSRGQLTYYFPEKEQILLAVFDRMSARMRQRVLKKQPPDAANHMTDVLEMILFRPLTPEFVGLQFTFLAQTKGRPDYRKRLANLYQHWRSTLIEELPVSRSNQNDATACTRASLFQAVAHGLAVQLIADPRAFDRREMMRICEKLFPLIVGKKTRKTKLKGQRHD